MAGRSTVKVAPKSRATALRNRGTPCAVQGPNLPCPHGRLHAGGNARTRVGV